jgi:hypothetical protein
MEVGATAPPIDQLFAQRLRLRLRAMLAPRYWKAGLATGFDVTGLSRAQYSCSASFWPWARALNYHDVPAAHARAFEEQLRFFALHFVNVGPAELAELHAGRWSHPKPGLLLTFDDGLRCHADVVAPLLEYGFTGWFTVPVGFVETPPAEQRAFAEAHQISCDASDLPDERIACRGTICAASTPITRSAATPGAIAASDPTSARRSSTSRSIRRSEPSRKAWATRCAALRGSVAKSGPTARRRLSASAPQASASRS